MLAHAAEASRDGLLLVDAAGEVKACNGAAADILGRPRAKIEGWPIAVLLPAVSPAANPGEMAGKAAHAVECRAPGRAAGAFEATAYAMSGDSLAAGMTLYALRPVPAWRKAAAASQEALEKLAAANRAKSQFIAHMSHELRTPLNAIIGFSEMMREETFGALEPRIYRQYVDHIHASGIHLLAVINDLLDLSRIETGNLALRVEEVPLARLIDTCRAIVKGWADSQARQIEWFCPDPALTLHVDERVIRQALLNILANAVKFTRHGGQVDIRAARQKDGALTLSVADDGIGIAQEKLASLAEPYRQINDSLARRQDGCGLGLYLTKRFMELHGGRLEVESALGHGTTVYLTLPAKCVAVHDMPRPAAAHAG
ncbi:MAG: ATP-binding protein [Pseudomonadota bacterium]